MRKSNIGARVCVLLALLLVMLIPACASAGSTAATATSVTLNSDEYVGSTISASSATHFYKIVLPEAGYLQLDTRAFMIYMNTQFYNEEIGRAHV